MAKKLTGADGLVAVMSEEGNLGTPNPWDQAAALWAYSSLSLSLTDPELPLYSSLPTSAKEATGFAKRGDALFAAMAAIDPVSVRDITLTIEAYGWFAAATGDAETPFRRLGPGKDACRSSCRYAENQHR